MSLELEDEVDKEDAGEEMLPRRSTDPNPGGSACGTRLGTAVAEGGGAPNTSPRRLCDEAAEGAGAEYEAGGATVRGDA